jgi:hypothetical protein
MRITPKQRLISRISSCLRLDKKKPTELHIEVDMLISYLYEFGIPVPPGQFERLVSKMMVDQVIGKIQLGQPLVMERIATAILQLAENIIQAAESTAIINAQTEPDEVSKVLEEASRKNWTKQFEKDGET